MFWHRGTSSTVSHLDMSVGPQARTLLRDLGHRTFLVMRQKYRSCRFSWSKLYHLPHASNVDTANLAAPSSPATQHETLGHQQQVGIMGQSVQFQTGAAPSAFRSIQDTFIVVSATKMISRDGWTAPACLPFSSFLPRTHWITHVVHIANSTCWIASTCHGDIHSSSASEWPSIFLCVYVL